MERGKCIWLIGILYVNQRRSEASDFEVLDTSTKPSCLNLHGAFLNARRNYGPTCFLRSI
ncbi:hypothetical protein LINPERHAP2_LOCUS5095 [Linum perenne]